jgi:hypothetical protein
MASELGPLAPRARPQIVTDLNTSEVALDRTSEPQSIQPIQPPHTGIKLRGWSPLGCLHLPDCENDRPYEHYVRRNQIFAFREDSSGSMEREALVAIKDHRNIASLVNTFEDNNVTYLIFKGAEFTLTEIFDYIPWNPKYVHRIAKSVGHPPISNRQPVFSADFV